MATIEENRRVWDGSYEWSEAGDEWSAQFGGTEALWEFVIYPRVHRFLPARSILEIAPGFGRWTQFLKTQCSSLIGIDLAEKCVEHCRSRFAADSHLTFVANDGISLEAVPDDSIDFVFSFDSLVHAEKDVMAAYLRQLARKLKPDGVGFVHHSNIGAFPGRLAFARKCDSVQAALGKKVLTRDHLSAVLSINLRAARAQSMTGDLFSAFCQEAGLKCVTQELINWTRGSCLIDALSVFTRPNSRWDKPKAVLRNPEFMASAALNSRLAKLYCG